MQPTALPVLLEQRLIAVIRAPSPAAALAAARAVAEGGIRMIEVTFTVPEATRVMEELAADPRITLGAGTVLEAAQARDALAAGARFVVAPNLSREVARVALDAGLLYVPGALTPTEIVAARAAGAHVVKVHPVGVLGPGYIRAVRDPLPDVPLLAAGGTTLESLTPFLEAGCVAVGVGPAIADPALAAAGQLDEITRRARAFLERAGSLDATTAAARGA